jgi:hypothetical protein
MAEHPMELVADYIRGEKEMGRTVVMDSDGKVVIPHWYISMWVGIREEQKEREEKALAELLERGREHYHLEQRGRVMMELLQEKKSMGLLKLRLDSEWLNKTEEERILYSKTL